MGRSGGAFRYAVSRSAFVRYAADELVNHFSIPRGSYYITYRPRSLSIHISHRPTPMVVSYQYQANVSSFHIRWTPLLTFKDHLPPLPPPPEPLIIQALTYLLQPQTFPTLVCCNMGRHRSGTVVGCYRKLQKWALSSILEEYRRYAGVKVRVLNEQVSQAWSS